MSYYDDDDDVDGGNGQRNPLRKTVNDLEKQVKKLTEQLEAEQAARSTAEKTVRQRTVADVLKDKKVNPGLARYVLADVEDPTPEAVEQWLTDNGELFGVKVEQNQSDPAQQLGLPAGTALPPDLVAAYERFQASQQGGAPAGAGGPADIAAKLQDPNLTQADLLALIAGAGN